jgi:hypothetical protein
MSWPVVHANHEECVLKIVVLNGVHPSTFHELLHITLPGNSSHGLADLLCLCYLKGSTIFFSQLTQGELHGQILYKTIIPGPASWSSGQRI